MSELSPFEWDVIKALADNDLNVCKAGRTLSYSRNGMQYRIDKIARKTGYDPSTFYGLRHLIEEMEDNDG